jgi:hypothetical protein
MKHFSTTILMTVIAAMVSVGCGEAHSEPAARTQPSAHAQQEERSAEVTHIRQPEGDVAPTQRVAQPTTATAPVAAPSVPVQSGSAVVAQGAISLPRIVIARGIENRAPVDPNTTFSLATLDKLYVYMEGLNTSGSPAELRVTFTREGSSIETGGVTVSLPPTTGNRAWRTWAFTRGARTPGNWTAHVTSADGTEVASSQFTITG